MAISGAKLGEAFEGLRDAWRGLGGAVGDGSGWVDVRVLEDFGMRYLSITRRLERRTLNEDNATTLPQDDVEEEDDEALPVQNYHTAMLFYDVVHSPSYQVPVLYITFSGVGSKAQLSPDEVYELLVPTAYTEQVRHVGVMGALSITDHPITGLPAYFVHPCRTQDALITLGADSQHLLPLIYLMRWIGLIGSSIGLSVPVVMAGSIARVEGVE